jgi:hypothetical protein
MADIDWTTSDMAPVTDAEQHEAALQWRDHAWRIRAESYGAAPAVPEPAVTEPSPPPPPEPRICKLEECTVQFLPRPANQVYCSPAHYEEAGRRRAKARYTPKYARRGERVVS